MRLIGSQIGQLRGNPITFPMLPWQRHTDTDLDPQRHRHRHRDRQTPWNHVNRINDTGQVLMTIYMTMYEYVKLKRNFWQNKEKLLGVVSFSSRGEILGFLEENCPMNHHICEVRDSMCVCECLCVECLCLWVLILSVNFRPLCPVYSTKNTWFNPKIRIIFKKNLEVSTGPSSYDSLCCSWIVQEQKKLEKVMKS